MTVKHGTMNRRTFAIAGLGVAFSARAAHAQSATPASPAAPGTALYRVDLPTETLPAGPFAVGAAGVLMTPGTTVEYPEGSAGQSVAIDHVLTGGYDVESGGEMIHIDAAGTHTAVEAGQATTVAAGESIVYLHNEAGQRITAGDEETYTFTFGLFSLEQGTNETHVEGTLQQEVLGGTILQDVPESGVTITAVSNDAAGDMSDSVAQVPVALKTGDEWTVVVLPLNDNA